MFQSCCFQLLLYNAPQVCLQPSLTQMLCSSKIGESCSLAEHNEAHEVGFLYPPPRVMAFRPVLEWGDLRYSPPKCRELFVTQFYPDRGLPWWLSGKESPGQCKRCGFSPWVRKILWRRAWHPTLEFLPGESWAEEPGGLQSIKLQRVGHGLATKQ